MINCICIIFRFCHLAVLAVSLSSCVYVNSHEYNAAPYITGNVSYKGKTVPDAKIILEYTANEKTSELNIVTSKTDKQGRFQLGPVKNHRKGLFIFGPADLLVPYKLSIETKDKTYLGLKSFGYWDVKGKSLLACELSQSAYPHLTHPEDLATRCKYPETPNV